MLLLCDDIEFDENTKGVGVKLADIKHDDDEEDTIDAMKRNLSLSVSG